MPLTPEQRLNAIATTAALYRPEQLHKRIELLLNALLFQHECVLNELLEYTKEDQQLVGFYNFAQDSRSLELIIKILNSVDPDFQRASEGTVQEVLELSKKQYGTDQLDDQKQQLENLLQDN